MPAAKPKAARPKKEKPPPGPDDLVRESAGAYRSGDGRFSVSQSDATWFVVDAEQANEFGQELIHGPFASLKQAQAALAGARTIKPLLRSTPRPKRPVKVTPAVTPPPPPSWIERLDADEQKEARRLIRVLEKEGLDDAEDLVRHHRADSSPVIAARVIEHRLRRLIQARPGEEHELAQAIASEVAEVLSSGGIVSPRPAPRWALVELEADEPTPKRAIRLRV